MKTLNLEKAITNQPAFAIAIAGVRIDDALFHSISTLFQPHIVGLSRRILHGGRALRITVTHEPDADTTAWYARIKQFAADHAISYAIFPDTAPIQFKVALMDMDSTLIGEEVIEELAEFAGKREHVARVTTMAMEGKLDFHAALRERVKLLDGQPASILDEVLRTRITPTPGLTEMIAGFERRSIHTAVVSGGFIPIVQPFAARHGIEHAFANQLEIVGGQLTGNAIGEIVDANVKHRVLGELCAKYGCSLADSIAIGDGANDLKMMKAAGLGVAFCAKQIVRDQALAAINRRRLDDVLLLLDEP